METFYQNLVDFGTGTHFDPCFEAFTNRVASSLVEDVFRTGVS